MHPVSRLVNGLQTQRRCPYPEVTHVSYTTLDDVTHQVYWDGLVRDHCELDDVFKIYARVSHLTQDTLDFGVPDYIHGRNCVTFLLHELNLEHLNLPTLPGPLLDALLRDCHASSFFNGFPYYCPATQRDSQPTDNA